MLSVRYFVITSLVSLFWIATLVAGVRVPLGGYVLVFFYGLVHSFIFLDERLVPN